MRSRRRRRQLLLCIPLALASVAGAGAQELEPRSYANLPVGLSFLAAGYSYVAGGIATDPTLPIEDAHLSVHGPLVGYAHAFGIAGRSAKIEVVAPYGVLSGSAQIAGEPRERHVSGFWDPKVRLAVNLLGSPALSPQEFASYRQNWILGASVQVGSPLGQYDDQRVINLGNHRWSVKPEIGVSKAVGRVVIDVAAGVTFYTANEDYQGGRTLQEAPVFAFQAHVVYNFVSRIWVAVDANYYAGGVNTIDGVASRERLSSSRVGGTVSVPVGRQHSIKLAASSGLSVRTGTDFDAVTLVWQYRWGGGLGRRK